MLTNEFYKITSETNNIIMQAESIYDFLKEVEEIFKEWNKEMLMSLNDISKLLTIKDKYLAKIIELQKNSETFRFVKLAGKIEHQLETYENSLAAKTKDDVITKDFFYNLKMDVNNLSQILENLFNSIKDTNAILSFDAFYEISSVLNSQKNSNYINNLFSQLCAIPKLDDDEDILEIRIDDSLTFYETTALNVSFYYLIENFVKIIGNSDDIKLLKMESGSLFLKFIAKISTLKVFENIFTYLIEHLKTRYTSEGKFNSTYEIISKELNLLEKFKNLGYDITNYETQLEPQLKKFIECGMKITENTKSLNINNKSIIKSDMVIEKNLLQKRQEKEEIKIEN